MPKMFSTVCLISLFTVLSMYFRYEHAGDIVNCINLINIIVYCLLFTLTAR